MVNHNGHLADKSNFIYSPHTLPTTIKINRTHLKRKTTTITKKHKKSKTFWSPTFSTKGSLRRNHHMKSKFIWVLLGNSLTGMQKWSKR